MVPLRNCYGNRILYVSTNHHRSNWNLRRTPFEDRFKFGSYLSRGGRINDYINIGIPI